MKRLFVKKTKNMKDNTEIKEWAEKLKEAEPHFIACANYCKKVKRLLKELDSANNKGKTNKCFEIVSEIELVWDNVKNSRRYLINNTKNIFKSSQFKNRKELRNHLNNNFNPMKQEFEQLSSMEQEFEQKELNNKPKN